MQTVLFLMGAGRSGTTALATMLGSSIDVQNLGELHQFFEHLVGKKHCSCGETLENCAFWGGVVEKLDWRTLDIEEFATDSAAIEQHRNVPKFLLGIHSKVRLSKYHSTQAELFEVVSSCSGKRVVLDSAKYVGRALSLSTLDDLDLKIIYLTRDPRGVVYSFSKKVQTSLPTMRAVLYYLTVNIAAEVARMTRLRGKVIKLRYEDMLSHPEIFFQRLSDFIGTDLAGVVEQILDNSEFQVGHIIGGNRIRASGTIRAKFDVDWNAGMTRRTKFLVWLATFPLNLLNRYPI